MKKILVADDSVTIQKVIALTFADEPFEVQSVGTGAEALEMMNTWKPDILLADVIMPQMNGYELCRAVKELQGTSDVPVLLLAGTFEAFDEEEAKSVGADGYITKPFESGELIEKVSLLVGEKPGAEHAPEPPRAETSRVDVPEVQAQGAPEPEQVTRTVPGPVQGAGRVDEPDIWDILSDTESSDAVPDSGIADAAVPGMGPIEDQGVVDVGSFDVGLDRPEQGAAPPEPHVDTAPEAPQAPSGPDGAMPAPGEPAAPPAAKPEPDLSEKSRVEDREKDFFGFETEGPEAAGEDAFLGDAVEEITFEMEESEAVSDDAKQEASFIVPEPAGIEIPVTGETVAPETMAPEPPAGEEPPLSLQQPFLKEPAPEVVAPSLEELAVKPESEETAPTVPTPPLEAFPEPEPPVDFSIPEEEPVAGSQDMPVIESIPEVPAAGPEAAAGTEPAADILVGQPSEKRPIDISRGQDEAEIRRIVEEKVEKIVWEVVPEMAEVLIREAIEKIKGKP